MLHKLNRIKTKLSFISQYTTSSFKDKDECPMCGYIGALFDVNPPTDYRVAEIKYYIGL